MAVFSDDGPPTAIFDGESARYSGPTSFEAGTVAFTFDATEYDPRVVLILARMNDDSLTMSDLEAYAADNPASVMPELVASISTIFVSDEVIERDMTLTEGTWSIWANTSPSETDKAHPAVIFEVTAAK